MARGGTVRPHCGAVVADDDLADERTLLLRDALQRLGQLFGAGVGWYEDGDRHGVVQASEADAPESGLILVQNYSFRLTPP
jgi:hypothetical protein